MQIDKPAIEIINVYIRQHTRPGNSGYLYDVIHEGQILTTSRDPTFAACRALVDKDLTEGELRLWREGKTTWDMSVDIARGAKLRTREDQKRGPVFDRYYELPSSLGIVAGTVATEGSPQPLECSVAPQG